MASGKHGKAAQKCARFRWTRAKEEAALFVADGTLSDEQIAEKVGASRRSICLWRLHPEFAERIAANLAEIRASVRERGIARLHLRVAALQDRWDRMKRIIEERGADDMMQSVAGGKTGLLVHNVKSIGGGEFAERVDLYEVDVGLLNEMRQHEKQAAQELGQWSDKHELTGKDGGPIRTKEDVFDDDDYRAKFAEFARGQVSGAGRITDPANGN